MAVKHIARSPECSPDFQKVKEVTEAPEAGPFAEEKHGVNMGHYLYAIIDVKVVGGNPTVGVLFWSPEAAAFVSDNPAISKVGLGAGVSYQFVVPCHGRRILPVVTAGLAAGQSAVISVAGYELDHTL